MNAEAKMIQKLKSINTEFLKEVLTQLMSRKDYHSGVVFNYAIEELRVRIPENEFVEFCETL